MGCNMDSDIGFVGGNSWPAADVATSRDGGDAVAGAKAAAVGKTGAKMGVDTTSAPGAFEAQAADPAGFGVVVAVPVGTTAVSDS